MRHRPLVRLIAFITALLGSSATPAQALAHGHAHEHLALDHGVHHERAQTPAATIADADNEHAHGHARLDAVDGTRDLLRLRVVPDLVVFVPFANTVELVPDTAHPPARTYRVLLARPGPERGPPPALRAPPTP